MSRKDFRIIADAIANLRFPVAPNVSRKIVANQFANVLAATNPRFKRQRFLDACGIEEHSEGKAA